MAVPAEAFSEGMASSPSTKPVLSEVEVLRINSALPVRHSLDDGGA